jgi:hypothetical protein
MSSNYSEFVSGLRCLSSCSYAVPNLPEKKNYLISFSFTYYTILYDETGHAVV